MASATRVVADPTPTPPDQIVLTLSVEEATVLRALHHYGVGGIGAGRKTLEGIAYALSDAGVGVGSLTFTGSVRYDD